MYGPFWGRENRKGKLFVTASSLKSGLGRLGAATPKSARPKSYNGAKARGSSQPPPVTGVTTDATDMETLATAVAVCGLTRVSRLLIPATRDAKQSPPSLRDAERLHPSMPRRMPLMPSTLADVLRIAEIAGLKPEKMLTCGGTDFRAKNTPFSIYGTFTMLYSGTAPEHEVYAAVICCVAQHLMVDSVIDDLYLSGAVTGTPMAGIHLPTVLRRMYEIASAHRQYTLVHGFSSIVPLLRFSTVPLTHANGLGIE